MIPVDVSNAINKALYMLPAQMASEQARVMLYAIGLQESRFKYRRQIVNGKPIGPAKGYWQFERGGGCKGVITHKSSRFWMHHICQARNVNFDAHSLWDAIENDDVLAAAAARLLLFTDPQKLPDLGCPDDAWALYIRVWRPGKPHIDTWADFYAEAMGKVIG